MISDDLKGLADSLGEFAGKVPQDVWQTMDRIRANLRSLSGQVRQLEAHFLPSESQPQPEGGEQ